MLHVSVVESLRELAEDHPMHFTFTRYNQHSSNLEFHGHVAEQIMNYRIRKLLNAQRRLDELYARGISQEAR